MIRTSGEQRLYRAAGHRAGVACARDRSVIGHCRALPEWLSRQSVPHRCQAASQRHYRQRSVDLFRRSGPTATLLIAAAMHSSRKQLAGLRDFKWRTTDRRIITSDSTSSLPRP